jgi:hypothetical protein
MFQILEQCIDIRTPLIQDSTARARAAHTVTAPAGGPVTAHEEPQ